LHDLEAMQAKSLLREAFSFDDGGVEDASPTEVVVLRDTLLSGLLGGIVRRIAHCLAATVIGNGADCLRWHTWNPAACQLRHWPRGIGYCTTRRPSELRQEKANLSSCHGGLSQVAHVGFIHI
jgi:hypothetical protein